MRASIPRAEFAAAAAAAARTASNRPVFPGADFVRLVVAGGEMRLDSTSMDLWRSERIGVSAAEDFAVMTHAATLAAFCRASSGGEVALELTGGGALLRSGRGHAVLPTLDANAFPPSGVEADTAASEPVDAKQMRADMLAALSAAARTDLKPHIRGVALSEGNWVGTDGYRMHVAATPMKGAALIGIEHAQAICDALGGGGEWRFGVTPSHWVLISAAACLHGPQMAYAYPDWRRVLVPSAGADAVTASKADLLEALASVTLGARGEPAVRLRAKDARLEIKYDSRANSGDPRQITAEADAPCAGEGEAVVNARYLSDALAAIDAEEIAISGLASGLNGSRFAIRIEAAQSALCERVAVVMSMADLIT